MFENLHAMAQPLSILLAGLGNPYIDTMDVEDLRELTRSSAAESERVCRLFSYLQRFVSIASSPSAPIATLISGVVAHAVEGVNMLFEDSGIALELKMAVSREVVLANGTRTLEALSSVLLMMHELSRPGDVVEVLTVADIDDVARIVFRNRNAYLKALNSDRHLVIALVEATLQSQSGVLSLSLEPLTVEMGFRKVRK